MCDSQIQLSRLPEGAAARVVSLDAAGAMRRRLQDLGLVEGTRVQCLQKSPAGDPTAYFIRGAVVALRAADSGKVFVQQ